jgi:hypothetical protein
MVCDNVRSAQALVSCFLFYCFCLVCGGVVGSIVTLLRPDGSTNCVSFFLNGTELKTPSEHACSGTVDKKKFGWRGGDCDITKEKVDALYNHDGG